MATCCAPACSQALPVKPQGVWARGSEAWAGSRDLRNLEFVRWGSSGPSSLMTRFVNGASATHATNGTPHVSAVCPKDTFDIINTFLDVCVRCSVALLSCAVFATGCKLALFLFRVSDPLTGLNRLWPFESALRIQNHTKQVPSYFSERMVL